MMTSVFLVFCLAHTAAGLRMRKSEPGEPGTIFEPETTFNSPYSKICPLGWFDQPTVGKDEITDISQVDENAICAWISRDNTVCIQGHYKECIEAQKIQQASWRTGIEHIGTTITYGKACWEKDPGFSEDKGAVVMEASCNKDMIWVQNPKLPKHWVNLPMYLQCTLMDLSDYEKEVYYTAFQKCIADGGGSQFGQLNFMGKEVTVPKCQKAGVDALMALPNTRGAPHCDPKPKLEKKTWADTCAQFPGTQNCRTAETEVKMTQNDPKFCPISTQSLPTFQGNGEGNICSYITLDWSGCVMGHGDECDVTQKQRMGNAMSRVEHVGAIIHHGKTCCELDKGFCEENGAGCDENHCDSNGVICHNKKDPKHFANLPMYFACAQLGLTPEERSEMMRTGQFPDTSGCKGHNKNPEVTWDHVEAKFGTRARHAQK